MFDKKNREIIEWSNTWHDCGKKDPNKRILLIGDSCSRRYMSSIAKLLPNYGIDIIACSFSLEDPRFHTLIEAFMKNIDFKYAASIIQLATKHAFYLDTNNEKDKNIFLQYSQQLIEQVKPFTNKIFCISSSAIMQETDVNKVNEVDTQEICRRNHLVKTFCKKNNFSFIDLYDYAKKNNFRYMDRFHFKDKSYERKSALFILNNLAKEKCISEKDIYYKDYLLKKIIKNIRINGVIKKKFCGICWKKIYIQPPQIIIKYFIFGFCVKERVLDYKYDI